MKNCPHCGERLDCEANSDQQANWFDAFWCLYPRKVAKASALKAWRKAATSEAIKDEIMRGLSDQIPEFRRKRAQGIQFIPHAATWLRGERWKDELEQAAPERPLTEHERWLAQRRADLLRYEQVNGYKPS